MAAHPATTAPGPECPAIGRRDAQLRPPGTERLPGRAFAAGDKRLRDRTTHQLRLFRLYNPRALRCETSAIRKLGGAVLGAAALAIGSAPTSAAAPSPAQKPASPAAPAAARVCSTPGDRPRHPAVLR